MKKKLSASILSSDILQLKDQIIELEEAGADMLHIDIMDGSFVPNLSFGSNIVIALKKLSKLPLDVHLMIQNPENHVQSFIDAGSDIITFHFEATHHVDKLIRKIKNAGIKSGIALLPSTLPQNLEYVIDIVDLVLVMSVNPGFGGQNFIHSSLNKIKHLSKMIKKDTLLSVDGGINSTNISQISSMGANTFVTGSYLYKNCNVRKNIESLRYLI